VTVTIDEIATADAAPSAAPHKISAHAGKSTATVKFTPSGGSGQVRAWRVTAQGNRKTGRNLGSLGVVCGIDRVGHGRLLGCERGVQRSEQVTYTEMGGLADGDYDVEVTVWADSGLM
jgi:hypothetical protein